ncbi:Uncharacterised protein [Candidatus Tiddalikarchaeum anstoanum]|nr:Uncharacterised protein [Candidatus Tiddalikarchaeum anstoanum]
MDFKKIMPYLCLIILLASQFIFGTDLTHHLHNAWIYNTMIKECRFIPYDPYLLNGEQITFAYGLVAYPVAGLVWFLLGEYTIDVLMALSSIAIFVILKMLVKNDLPVSILTLAMLFHTLGDTYVFYISNLLFYLGLLLYYKHVKFWQVPIILSCINHPIAILPAIYFIFKDKKLFAVLSTVIVYFLVITFLFSKSASMTPYLPLVIIARTFLLLFPVFIIEDLYKGFNNAADNIHTKIAAYSRNRTVTNISKKIITSSKKNISFFKKLFDFKVPLLYVIAMVLISMFSVLILSQIYFQTWNYSLYAFNDKLFYNFPNISGSVRVVDYNWLPALLFTPPNVTFFGGSFRENNNIDFSTHVWDNSSYYSFLVNNSINYVLVCKQCNLPTNEPIIVRTFFSKYWENDYYTLYIVR